MNFLIYTHSYTTNLYLIYSAGLSEAASIKISDIDNERMMIKVTQGKGRKDRYVMLSENVLEQLRIYYKRTDRKNGYLKVLQGINTLQKEQFNMCLKTRVIKGILRKMYQCIHCVIVLQHIF